MIKNKTQKPAKKCLYSIQKKIYISNDKINNINSPNNPILIEIINLSLLFLGIFRINIKINPTKTRPGRLITNKDSICTTEIKS
jgi:hypothetical protein